MIMNDATSPVGEGISPERVAPTQQCIEGPMTVGWPYTPHVIIFFSSACIMVVELVAGRLIARHLGSSLYTWTSIIGVVLAGMSIGNYIGGRMADRWKPERSLGWLFLVASLSCVLALGLNSFVAYSQQGWKMLFPLRVILSTLFIFLLPALVLGTISPVTAKMALDRSMTVGSTIGSVYAWGAAGSIVGTFATGFFLIAALGAKGVVLLIAAGLGLIGLCLGPWRIVHAVWVVVVVFFLWLSQTHSAVAFQIACRYGIQEGEKKNTWSDDRQQWEPNWEKGQFIQDGNYQYVRVFDSSVYDEAIGRARQIRGLQLDYLIHGYVDLTDPSYLKYAYEKVYAEVAKLFVGDKKEVTALFLGGGSYTFPRWVQWRWPKAICDVAEIDPLVVEANHEALGLDRATSIRTYAMDARMALDELPPERHYDLILGDAFTDLSVPYHLSTVEFQRKLAARLSSRGVLMQNLIDDLRTGGLFLGAYMLTLKEVFEHVYVITTERQGIKKGRDTFVLVAFNGDRPLLKGILERYVPGHHGMLEGSILSEEQIADLARRCRHRILTDDNAPVENLLEPVVRRRGET
jgi:spermidine synthase